MHWGYKEKAGNESTSLYCFSVSNNRNFKDNVVNLDFLY